MSDVTPIKEALRAHKEALLSSTIERIRSQAEGYTTIDDATLRRDVGGLIDAVVNVIGSNDASEVYAHQLATVQQRIERGVSLQQYLRAMLLGFPILRGFAQAAGLPFDEFEKALVLLVINAGEAYTRAYEAHVARLERERRRVEIEAARLRSLSELVAGVAHELNTPLGVINQATSMVTSGLEAADIPTIGHDERAREILTDMAEAFVLIQKNVLRVDNLVKSFKSLSVQQNTDEPTACDPREILDGALATYRGRASKDPVVAEIIDRREHKERPWRGRAIYLRDILVGLLINIERYAYDAPPKTARIELGDSDGGLRLVVMDEGKGIAPEHVGKVFDPFFTTGRSMGACGLGLSIIHNLVTQAMQGKVELSSTVGKGTRVTLDLPSEPSPAPA